MTSGLEDSNLFVLRLSRGYGIRDLFDLLLPFARVLSEKVGNEHKVHA